MKLNSIALTMSMPLLENRRRDKETQYAPGGMSAGKRGVRDEAEPATLAGNSAIRADPGSPKATGDGPGARSVDFLQGLQRALSVLAAHAEQRPDHQGIDTALEAVQRNLGRYVSAADAPASAETTGPGIDLHAGRMFLASPGSDSMPAPGSRGIVDR